MPFKSDAQRRFMFARHPEIAQRWAKEGKGYVVNDAMKKMIEKNHPGNSMPMQNMPGMSNMPGMKDKNKNGRAEAIKRRLARGKKGK